MTEILKCSADLSFLEDISMDYISLGFGIIIGVIAGALLMWYYWRRYITPARFRQEVDDFIEMLKAELKQKMKEQESQKETDSK